MEVLIVLMQSEVLHLLTQSWKRAYSEQESGRDDLKQHRVVRRLRSAQGFATSLLQLSQARGSRRLAYLAPTPPHFAVFKG
jgi:hypothetical protein